MYQCLLELTPVLLNLFARSRQYRLSRFCSINRLHADIRAREPLLLGQPPVFTCLHIYMVLWLQLTMTLECFHHRWEAWERSNLGHGLIDLNIEASFSKATGYRRFIATFTVPVLYTDVQLLWHMKIDPLKSQDPHTIVGSRLICSSRNRLVVIAMAFRGRLHFDHPPLS